jgi:hypothetical protein
MERRRLEMVGMEFLDARVIAGKRNDAHILQLSKPFIMHPLQFLILCFIFSAEDTCTAGRSEASCEVTASNSIVINTKVEESNPSSKSEICSIIASIQTFMDESYTSGDVYGIDETQFKGSDFDCSDEKDGLKDGDNGQIYEYRNYNLALWSVVIGLGSIIICACALNQRNSKETKTTENDEDFEEEHKLNKTHAADSDQDSDGTASTPTMMDFFKSPQKAGWVEVQDMDEGSI